MTEKMKFADLVTRFTYYPSLTIDDRLTHQLQVRSGLQPAGRLVFPGRLLRRTTTASPGRDSRRTTTAGRTRSGSSSSGGLRPRPTPYELTRGAPLPRSVRSGGLRLARPRRHGDALHQREILYGTDHSVRTEFGTTLVPCAPRSLSPHDERRDAPRSTIVRLRQWALGGLGPWRGRRRRSVEVQVGHAIARAGAWSLAWVALLLELEVHPVHEAADQPA